jgi:hypothetical protein
VSDGFRDYVGGFFTADWGGNEDMGVLGDANETTGSFLSSNTTTAGTGLPGAYVTGALKCQTCHNPGSEPTNSYQTLTAIRFPSMNLSQSAIDRDSGLCSQCHQGTGSTPSLNAYVDALTGNQGMTPVTLNATGGTTSTLDVPGLVTSAYKGYTVIFAGNPTPDLNGTTCSVVDNTTTVITLGCTLTVSPGAETVTLYPTATAGGTTSKLVDASRNWTGSLVGRFVYLYNNKGSLGGTTQPAYGKIVANTTNTLTFSPATSAAVAAGQFYQIIPNEVAATLDAQLAGATYYSPHELGAAATYYGANAAGYYEYPVTWDPSPLATTKQYLRLGGHATNNAPCTSCHDAHALAIPTTFDCSAQACHKTHSSTPPLPNQQMGSLKARTGFWYMGGTDQGVYQNYVQMMAKLYTAIQQYSLANGNVGAGTKVICFNQSAASHQDFFVGTAVGQSDGACSTTVWGAGGSNTAYTPRLLRAVYNYKFLVQDPGAWAHNPKYVTEVMYDAIRDLNMGIPAGSQIVMTGWTRP